ncbi:MAG: ABC-three component system protein [Phenylobacterium sp.]|uniref:ABC-three component system protein n=1 Tax=Phenylobacterium sp. TaxID=1871053 RepID=UPI003919595D
MIDNSAFAAAPSLAGYLYQARVALALCLRYAYVEGSVEVAVERLDDVSFESDGLPIELLQTKHRLTRRSDLSDASADLWKTLRIWSEQAKADPSLPSRTRLVLMTTGVVDDGAIAALLRPAEPGGVISGETAREASERLTLVAESSANTALKPSFDAYLALTPRMRAALISAVQVLDGQPMVAEVGEVIEAALRMAAPRGQAGRARELLEGWWWPRIIEALVQTPVQPISILEIETKLDEIRETLQRTTLTTEFEDASPPDAELKAYEGHGFVRQLRAIGIGGNRIEHAKRDYYRAFSQRSHWVRQHAVLDGEMARFEATLVEEWEPRFNAMCDRHPATPPDDQALLEAGQEVYHWVETEARFPFRTLVKRFLNVGSYHMLANALRVGWHRDFQKIGRDED